MTHRRIPRLTAPALAALLFLTPLLGGCSMKTTPDPAEASKASETLGQQVGQLVTTLIDVAGEGVDLEIDEAREVTCLRPEDDAPQTNTRWIGQATGPVSTTAAANEALDRVDRHLQEQGWEKKNEVKDPEAGTRVLAFRKGDLGASAEITAGPPRPSLEIFISSPCTDQPAEHRMQRLDIDPKYGQNSKFYDDWK